MTFQRDPKDDGKCRLDIFRIVPWRGAQETCVMCKEKCNPSFEIEYGVHGEEGTGVYAKNVCYWCTWKLIDREPDWKDEKMSAKNYAIYGDYGLLHKYRVRRGETLSSIVNKCVEKLDNKPTITTSGDDSVTLTWSSQ